MRSRDSRSVSSSTTLPIMNPPMTQADREGVLHSRRETTAAVPTTAARDRPAAGLPRSSRGHSTTQARPDPPSWRMEQDRLCWRSRVCHPSLSVHESGRAVSSRRHLMTRPSARRRVSRGSISRRRDGPEDRSQRAAMGGGEASTAWSVDGADHALAYVDRARVILGHHPPSFLELHTLEAPLLRRPTLRSRCNPLPNAPNTRAQRATGRNVHESSYLVRILSV